MLSNAHTLVLPFDSDDANEFSKQLIVASHNSSSTFIPDKKHQRVDSFDNDVWPKIESIMDVMKPAFARNLLFADESFPAVAARDRVEQVPLGIESGHQRTISALSFTLSELEGMGSSWATKQKESTKASLKTAATDWDAESFAPTLAFADMPIPKYACSSHRRDVSSLSCFGVDVVVARKMHSRDISALSFLNYDLEESSSFTK
jgi:hypothetical protein